MNVKNIFLSLVLASFCCIALSAQSTMGQARGENVEYVLRTYSTELIPANYSSEDAPVAVLYLKDAQQRVCANLYFYANDSVMHNQQASRDQANGLVEDHYHIDLYDLMLRQLKDRALKHTMFYNTETNQLSIQSQPRSSNTSRELKAPARVGTK